METAVDDEFDVPDMDLHGGVRGKYYEDYQHGTNVMLLEPDVAAVFSRLRVPQISLCWSTLAARGAFEARLIATNGSDSLCSFDSRLTHQSSTFSPASRGGEGGEAG